jgi:hypothetical protein
MIDLVLATDMKQHFALISQFKAAHTACCGKGVLGDRDVSKTTCLTSSAVNSGSELLKPVDEPGRILALQASRIACLPS